MRKKSSSRVALLLCLLAAAAPAAADERPASRPERGKLLFQTHCAVCHGSQGAGDGAAEYLLSPRPRDFTRGSFKIRSTATGSLPTDQDLFGTISSGMAGTAMPAWDHLSAAERWALVDVVKTFSPRFREEGPGETVTIAEPPADFSRLVPAGKAAYEKYRCGECHGAAGQGDGPSSGTLRDDTGFPIRPYDFTRPGRYKGGDAPGDIYRTFTTGFDGTPMPSFAYAIPEEDRWSIVAYVKSLSASEPAAARSPANGILEVSRVKKLPVEPDAAAWESLAEYEIPLRPVWGRENTTPAVRVSAATDGKRLAVRMKWRDTSVDLRMLRPEDFRDAAAVQFSLAGPDVTFAMGARDKPVNIWHWKADWQKDLAGREDIETVAPRMVVDLYPFSRGGAVDPLYLTGRAAGNAFSRTDRASPVEDLNAGGIGTLTSQPPEGQNVGGKGVWSDGQWRVVFIRSLASNDREDARLEDGVPVAFAVWNGSEGDRNGNKAFSVWYRLRFVTR